MMTASQIALSGVLVLTALAGAWDYRTGHIPNKLVLGGAVLGVASHLALYALLLPRDGQSLGELMSSAVANMMLGVLICGAVPLLLYRTGAMGGGDVKLLAAIGAWLGPVLGLQAEMYGFIVAAVYAPARLAYQGQLLRLLGNSAVLLSNPFLPKARRRKVPEALLTELRFGPALFVGCVLVTLVRWSGS